MTDYDAVLLDLDGTLCAYVRGTEELLPAAFDTVGVDPVFEPADYHERVDLYADRAESMRERRRLCFADLVEERGHDRELGHAVADAYAAERNHSNVRFLPGAREALTTLADAYPLALVTNGGPVMQDQKIDGLGVREYFETIVYAGHETPAKPDPEPFERALEALGVAPGRAVYVGNNYEADIVGAANAGLDAVLVGTAVDGPVEPLSTITSMDALVDSL